MPEQKIPHLSFNINSGVLRSGRAPGHHAPTFARALVGTACSDICSIPIVRSLENTAITISWCNWHHSCYFLLESEAETYRFVSGGCCNPCHVSRVLCHRMVIRVLGARERRRVLIFAPSAYLLNELGSPPPKQICFSWPLRDVGSRQLLPRSCPAARSGLTESAPPSSSPGVDPPQGMNILFKS